MEPLAACRSLRLEPISRSLCQSSSALLKSRIPRSFYVSRVLPPLRFVKSTSEPSARSLGPFARSLNQSSQLNNPDMAKSMTLHRDEYNKPMMQNKVYKAD
ncbi:hypothetical protein Tco_0984732 [Tanacetum coccineum]